MSGKPYQMQEMRQIVEYLVEHRAYGDTKGRKMWMDFANSKMTNRTWQSLKETFLKRILPDIHNPYYKLNMCQIASFREGHDMEKRMNSKLEVRELSHENVSNGNTKSDAFGIEETKIEAQDKGENNTNSKSDRDSTETLVLNNCYDTADDIKRDLLTPDDELKDTTKKLRDLIEFEPMTPDVQRLIDDFVSEDEDPKIVLDPEDTDIEKSNKTIPPNKEPVNKPDNIPENIDSESQLEKVVSSTEEVEKNITNVTTTTANKENSKTILNVSDTITSTHSTMPDSILPNNQEELNKDKINKKTLSLNKKDDKNETNKKLPAKRKNENHINSISSNSDNTEQRDAVKKSKTTDDTTDTNVKTVVNLIEEVEVLQDDNNEGGNETSLSQNPCLQSVNLYNESLDADHKNSATDNYDEKQQPSTSTQAPKNDVVVLKSHSESETNSSVPDRKRMCLIDSKRYKDNALANVFGFKSGAVRRRRSHRKRSISHQRVHNVTSGSSDWTSDTVSEYVSPPRGRRNRHSKKYLKPKSVRVTSLEKNGGLFVVYNNRIYPLVKDGKVVKNHLNYISDDESDADRKAWKKKYFEEKKKTEELERLINRMQEKIEERRISEVASSSKCNELGKQNQEHPRPQENKEETKQESDSKSVKIKFTKNNEEVQLEGPLTQITPALAQVMELLQKSGSDKAYPKQNVARAQRGKSRTPSSLISVSLDDVQEKVDKLESEIFKEIEEQDKHESIADDNTTDDKLSNVNVTKRRAVRRRALSSTSVSPKGAPKKSKVEKKYDKSEKKQEDIKSENEKTTVRETRRTSRKTANDILNTDSKTIKRSSRVKTNEISEKTTNGNTIKTNDDSDIRYKFPSTSTTERKTGYTRKSQQKKSNSTTKTETLPYNMSYSSESMQGDRDFDASPPKVTIRVYPSCSTSSKTQSHRFLSTNGIDDESESSNSFPEIKRSITFHNSTSSEVHKSDSYQLLMPINTLKVHTKRSDNIKRKRDVSFVSKMNETIIRNLDNAENDGQSSSNISPPTSPVISIVENISINRSLLTSVDDLQADEMDQIESNHNITLNTLMKSDQNAPKPLMEQDYGFDSDHNDGVNYHYNIQVKNTNKNTLTPTSQSLVNKLNTISLRDFNATDSVYVRLEKLMLDSDKKSKNKDSYEKENKKIIAEENNSEKGKTKKRSSTPRKKTSTTKVKRSSKDPSIEKEHVERNACVSRNSCPAMLENTETINTKDTNKTVEKTPKKSKELKKLNIIKVKITKPKNKIKDQSEIDQMQNTNTSQIEMNSTKSTTVETDNSIDLIHNHSETCLQAHECIDNSVEIVEKSPTIISLTSEKSDGCETLFNIEEFLTQELYSSNARNGIKDSPECQTTAECPDLFYTPLGPLSSATSLMTEDLTCDIPEHTTSPKTKWYLLSEDEATTNFIDLNQNILPKDVGYGANLNDLFPVTCAVPNLSTITEMSKENDADTRSNLNSPLPETSRNVCTN